MNVVPVSAVIVTVTLHPAFELPLIKMLCPVVYPSLTRVVAVQVPAAQLIVVSGTLPGGAPAQVLLAVELTCPPTKSNGVEVSPDIQESVSECVMTPAPAVERTL